MYEPFKVLDGAGRCVETHSNPKAAARAALVLSAHAVKNGHTGDYRCDPPNFFLWNELDLPDWAIEALGLAEE